MKKSAIPRIIMFVALLFIAATLLAPIWSITLEALQFPEGLKMYIWMNKISGDDAGTLQNVNNLNHYIGMKEIHPESIPELKYFPIVVYVMLGLGVITVIINKSWGYLSWTILLVVLSILAVYDFYLWLYDYGHNLDPKAPITVRGGSFMPPLFGEKQMMNFYVKSYPGWGTVFLGLSLILSFFAFWKRKKS